MREFIRTISQQSGKTFKAHVMLGLQDPKKSHIKQTIAAIRDDGVKLGSGDFVNADDLENICDYAELMLYYIQQLERERDAAQADMETIARQTTDNFVCTYCGAKTLEECGKCQMRNESFKWRGLQEGEHS